MGKGQTSVGYVNQSANLHYQHIIAEAVRKKVRTSLMLRRTSTAALQPSDAVPTGRQWHGPWKLFLRYVVVNFAAALARNPLHSRSPQYFIHRVPPA